MLYNERDLIHNTPPQVALFISVSSGVFRRVFGRGMSYSDAEFGGKWNVKGNVCVQEVRVVQTIHCPLVNRLKTENSQSETETGFMVKQSNGAEKDFRC